MASSAQLHYSFSGKRVLVTGGASGIGRAVVQKFYDDGAHVFVLDCNQATLVVVKTELPNVTTVCVDLLDWNGTKSAVEALLPLDHLVNNAGIMITASIMEATQQDIFDKTFGVNVKAIVNVSQVFVKGILDHKKVEGGTIVNIGSIADSIASPGVAIYASSKAAITSLTKSLAQEFAGLNNHIRVNCISPGAVLSTNLIQDVTPEMMEVALKAMDARTIIKHRGIEPADIANGVLFFSSPLSSMITGQSLVIDQGYLST